MARDYGTTNVAPWASAPTVGAAGATYFNTASKTLCLSDGTVWLSSTASPIGTDPYIQLGAAQADEQSAYSAKAGSGSISFRSASGGTLQAGISYVGTTTITGLRMTGPAYGGISKTNITLSATRWDSYLQGGGAYSMGDKGGGVYLERESNASNTGYGYNRGVYLSAGNPPWSVGSTFTNAAAASIEIQQFNAASPSTATYGQLQFVLNANDGTYTPYKPFEAIAMAAGCYTAFALPPSAPGGVTPNFRFITGHNINSAGTSAHFVPVLWKSPNNPARAIYVFSQEILVNTDGGGYFTYFYPEGAFPNVCFNVSISMRVDANMIAIVHTNNTNAWVAHFLRPSDGANYANANFYATYFAIGY